MSEDRAPIQHDPARARRQAAGLVAQYIHELSQRHADARRAAPAGEQIRDGREAEAD